MSQDFAVSRLDGSDVIDHEEQEYPASALVRTGQNGPSFVTMPVPQISVNHPSNSANHPSNSVNQPNNLVHQQNNLLTPQTHVQNTRIATEPRDPTTHMFAGLEVPVDEPGFHDNAGSADGTDSEEDQDLDESARAMDEEQKSSMLEAIAAADNPQAFMRDFKSAIPNGFEMTLWELRLMMAPDKWVRNQEKQQSAVIATQNFEYAMDVLERQTGEIQRKDWKYHHEDPQVTEEKREPTGLRGYHLSSHMKATKHLEFLYNSMLNGNWVNDPNTQRHRGALDKINRDLKRRNEAYNYKSDIGCVDYFRLLGKWKFLHSSREMDDAVLKIAEVTTVAFCRELQYPNGWLSCPPQESYRYEPVQGYQSLLWSSLTPCFHSWYQKALAGSQEVVE
ncbi:hypothetical protein BO71DRAFT_429948 [Aspergillus ellipticus CBS 707.79]|uniref:Uncharacterized protein n=1 Tax=Aspergillus ellipticus CBS 707.79 TaxID=1448320 RepID=A0A319DAP8_9EURO|nr:hypothetical protein BO71DRAFT_429948 [Aspergillus ellipticus CBS 707.79]